MRKQGRNPKPFSETDLQMIREYLETDMSLKEVAEKYGTLSAEGLRYRVNKYRKEQKNGKKGKRGQEKFSPETPSAAS